LDVFTSPEDKLKEGEEQKYDRIVWNFPHAGFPDEEKNEHRGPGFEWADQFHERHVTLLEMFFSQVMDGQLLKTEGGKVVMTHKTIEPFSLWDIPGIA
jgi:hypothetical protein